MERFVYGEEEFAISICTKDWKLTFRSKNNPSMNYLLLCKLVQRYSDNFQDFRDEVDNLICGKEAFIVFRGKFFKNLFKRNGILLKFGHSGKATKFETIFHFLFDATK